MKLLLLNTCGAEGTIGLADTDLPEPVVATEHLPGRGSSEQLMPALRRIFEETGWTVGAVGAVAVVHGPGSFTGVRVGLSAAKGFCEARAIPMIAISRLALLAAVGNMVGETVALLDGGRGEFYVGLYDNGECLSEKLQTRDEVAGLVVDGSRGVLTCEAPVAERWPELGMKVVEEPGPEEILALAKRRIAAGEWTEIASIDANYLRRTDAELLVERRAASSVA